MPTFTCAIVGASGATGQPLVLQALERGHRVRVHCRPSSSWVMPPNVTAVRSDFDDRDALQTLVRGADAVFCLVGPRPPHRDVFCAAAVRALIEAMRREGTERLLCLTGAMIAPDNVHLSVPARAMAAIFGRFRPEVAADRSAQEALVRESKLQWTLFKPPRLTNGPPTAQLQTGANLRVGLRSFVPRAQLAACMLQAAEQGLYLGECVFLDATA